MNGLGWRSLCIDGVEIVLTGGPRTEWAKRVLDALRDELHDNGAPKQEAKGVTIVPRPPSPSAVAEAAAVPEAPVDKGDTSRGAGYRAAEVVKQRLTDLIVKRHAVGDVQIDELFEETGLTRESIRAMRDWLISDLRRAKSQWSPERRAAQSARIQKVNEAKRAAVNGKSEGA